MYKKYRNHKYVCILYTQTHTNLHTCIYCNTQDFTLFFSNRQTPLPRPFPSSLSLPFISVIHVFVLMYKFCSSSFCFVLFPFCFFGLLPITPSPFKNYSSLPSSDFLFSFFIYSSLFIYIFTLLSLFLTRRTNTGWLCESSVHITHPNVNNYLFLLIIDNFFFLQTFAYYGCVYTDSLQIRPILQIDPTMYTSICFRLNKPFHQPSRRRKPSKGPDFWSDCTLFY